MYKEFYGFQEEPFNVTPDPEFIYYSDQHKEALAHMLYGVRERKGFILITGRVGSGKTTLCRAFLEELDDSVSTALILNSAMGGEDLLQTILEDLGLEVPGEATQKQLVDRLNSFVLEEYRNGRNVCVIIDEAQNLSVEALEKLRLLSNLETDKQKLLQMVLVGQPELDNLINRPDLRQLRQRITVRSYLTNLNREETEEYVLHRMNQARPEHSIKISNEVFPVLYETTGGNPRSVNIIMDRMLMAGYVDESYVLSIDQLERAFEELKEEEKTGVEEVPRIKNHKKITARVNDSLWPVYAGGAAVITVIIGLAVAWLAQPEVSPVFGPELASRGEIEMEPAADEKEKETDFEPVPLANNLEIYEIEQIPAGNRLGTLGIARYISADPAAGQITEPEFEEENFSRKFPLETIFEEALPGRLVRLESSLQEVRRFSFPALLMIQTAGGQRYAVYFPGEDIFWDPLEGWKRDINNVTGEAGFWVETELDLTRSYRRGTSGDTAVKIQELLNTAGDYNIPLHYRHYGPMTVETVKDFQQKMDLPADGVFDLRTAIYLLEEAGDGRPELEVEDVRNFLRVVNQENVAN